ncbi:MAG: hypothetical protein K2H45_01575 [Acetatifactor sp.]|nr:hypothetical protein [Acetatifactor sp.]
MKRTIYRQAIPLSLALSLTGMQLMGFHISMKYQTSVHIHESFRRLWELPNALLLCLALLEFVVFYALLRLLFTALERRAGSDIPVGPAIPRWCWGFVGGILFLCWRPCLAPSYPGFFNYDLTGQLPQAMYPENQYNSHHPLLHTLIMGKIITWGFQLSGQTDLTFGILLHSLFQMLFCTVVLTCFIRFILRITGRRWAALLALLYYALFPVIAMFSMSTTKDVMCCAILVLCAIQLYCLFEDPDRFLGSRRSCAGLILCFVLLCMLRKNSIYAVVLLALAMLLCFKDYRRKSAAMFGIILVVYFLCDRGLFLALDAKAGGISEAFSVPFQQIARTYCVCGEAGFEDEELELLEQVADAGVWQNYNPLLADHVKNFINFEPVKSSPGRYLGLWLKVGLRHPREYLMSFLENTYQAWYPGTSIITRISDHYIYYFDFDMSLKLERFSKNEKLLGFYEKISKDYYYQKLPGIRLLFSVGAMFWVTLITFCYGLWCRDRSIIYPVLLILAFCLTNLLGPVVLVRYYLMLFYGFPVCLGYLFKRRSLPGKTERKYS